MWGLQVDFRVYLVVRREEEKEEKSVVGRLFICSNVRGQVNDSRTS